MKALVLVGSVALSLLLGGCAAQTSTQPVAPPASPSVAAGSKLDETKSAVTPPEVVPEEQQKFIDANGQEMTYEEKVASNALPVTLYKNGAEATRAMFNHIEDILEHYPTEAEVRNNLGYSTDQKLSRDDYMVAAGLYADTYNINYDSTPSRTGNSLPAVIRRIAVKNVEQQYNRLNDSDSSNDSTPFNATITLAQSQTSFTYVDNIFNVTPDAYGISASRGMSLSYGEVANHQYPSNTMLSAKK